jgi:lipoic acid synthetase
MSDRPHSRPPVRKPAWLKRSLPNTPAFGRVSSLISEEGLHTVCQEAKCPNQWECFSNQTATFLIMGPACTRNCRFCAVVHDPSGPLDPEEPRKVARAVKALGLRFAVITSVTRDDLPDGGASRFAETITRIKSLNPGTMVEVLVPDFLGSVESLRTVLQACPEVFNHNLETVPSLYARARPGADYRRSLDLLRRAHELNPDIPTKTGLMLGLGETGPEVIQTLEDCVQAGCRILTLGQYLQPSRDHLPVQRYLSPEEFEGWKRTALNLGFQDVASGPFVRSSYRAHSLYLQGKI